MSTSTPRRSSFFTIVQGLDHPAGVSCRPVVFPDLVADASEMEHVFANSGLDWTIVRPPRLADKPRTGVYRVREDYLPRYGFTISRADVADFMLKCAENHVSSRKIVGVFN